MKGLEPLPGVGVWARDSLPQLSLFHVESCELFQLTREGRGSPLSAKVKTKQFTFSLT